MALFEPSVEFSFTILRDHAEASVKVIKDSERHLFARYEIVSTWPMDYYTLVKEVGDALGVEYESQQMGYWQAVEAFCR